MVKNEELMAIFVWMTSKRTFYNGGLNGKRTVENSQAQ